MYKLFRAAETPKPVVQVSVQDEEAPVEQILLPCPICFRTFKVESLDRHKNVCQKVATKKRKPFDSAKQRLEDLPDVPKVTPSPTHKVPSSPLIRRSVDKSKVPSWRENHLSLIKTVREARGADSNRCPCCERNFGDKAFDRHVEWCREQQSRIPKSPTNSEAKERWEARTKYRAPVLRRSIRSKYSPTRSLYSASASPAASVDRLTVPDCAQSLSGSRASLDSRASSTYSYQPSSTFSRSYSNNNNTNSNNNLLLLSSKTNKNNLYNSNTVGRASGTAFLRQSNDRRSLRMTPPSPPPIRRVVEPPLPVTLTPINNNRTSALRASLRMKNPFSSMSTSFGQQQQQPVNPKPVLSRQPTSLGNVAQPVVNSNNNNNNHGNTKRPTVLQLFTSAFSRPSPVAPAKNRGNAFSASQLGQGRRSEPEGVESKMMTGSCYNYTTPTKLKPSRRSTHPNLGKRLVIGTSILPNKVRPLTYKNKSGKSSGGSRLFGADNSYNPYLSAERQMAELFDDRPKESPTTPKIETAKVEEDPASMEQLEQDLKSILSEISQLGQNSTKEREISWQNKKSSSSISSPAIRLSKTTSSPPVSTPEEAKHPVPKFCHSCGASYPERHTVKFCCQCGARRLYI